MKKVLTIIITIVLVSSALSGWLGYSFYKKLNQNKSLKSKISALIKEKQSANQTNNFVPSSSTKPIYDFAQENQGLLKKIDCYCGCQSLMHIPNHKSLANCFVKEITSYGRIIYDNHGENCKTCLNEALEAKKWFEKAKNYSEIKNLIDKKYKPLGMN